MDDSLGDPIGGPNPIGAYLNGTPLTAAFSAGSRLEETIAEQSVTLNPGENTIYLYQRDIGSSHSGAIFSVDLACNPFENEVRMSLYPHPRFQHPIWARIETPGCRVPLGEDPNNYDFDRCPIKFDLNAALPDSQALRQKCLDLTTRINTTCGDRFEAVDINCGQNPFPASASFRVRDKYCSGEVPFDSDDGIIYVMANAADALNKFVSGSILPDYERDTVIPGCAETGKGANATGFGGMATGGAIVGGGQGRVSIEVATEDGATVSASVTTTAGQPAQEIVDELASSINDALIGVQDTASCSVSPVNPSILSCARPNGRVPSASMSSNDEGISMFRAGGAPNAVADLIQTTVNGRCPDLETNCNIVGPQTTSVPALGHFGASVLVFALGLIGTGLRRRLS